MVKSQLYYRRKSLNPRRLMRAKVIGQAYGRNYYDFKPMQQPKMRFGFAKRKHKSAAARKRLGKVVRSQYKARGISKRNTLKRYIWE